MLAQISIEKILFLDIETVPQHPHLSLLSEAEQVLWSKKAAHIRNRVEDSLEQSYERAGIYAEFGKIICISVALFKRDCWWINSYYGHDEVPVLEGFQGLLQQIPSDTLLCAHNGKEFDFPYLSRRMLINGMQLPKALNFAGKKPWEVPHLDTLELWKFGDYKHYTSLDLLSAIFGIPSPKTDMEGNQVFRVYWQEEDLERIRKYCQQDVLTLIRLLHKFKNLPLPEADKIQYV